MSEIDLKAPFLCQQLALSEKESLNGLQIDKYQDNRDECFDACTKNYNGNMFRSLNSGYRLSETTTSKRSSPLKINTKLMRSSLNPLGRSSDFNQNSDLKAENPVWLQNIGEDQHFECQHQVQTDKTCQVCKGSGFVKGNSNLIRFFEYLIGFKLGINGNYKQKIRVGGKKVEINNFCSDFYAKNQAKNTNASTNNFTYRINARGSEKQPPIFKSCLYNDVRNSQRQILNQSERLSTKTSRICCKEDMVQELNSLVVVHQSYRCDNCACSPIIGPRYHCHDCEDFDSCQSCYTRYPHPHMMEKIQKNGKGKQLQHLITFLTQPTQKNLRQSLKPPPSILVGNGSIKTTRSAIR